MVLPPEMEHWICPNDRHLTLRAKLGTGWSFHTGRANRQKSDHLTGEEMDHIVRVVRRSEMLEETEQRRIGCLVDRLENMKSLASGNGTSQCVLCGHEFSILGRKSSSRCYDCKLAVCSKCGVDAGSYHCHQPLWLCKICSEHRELWKRSGAWFYKALPRYILPKRRPDGGSRASVVPQPNAATTPADSSGGQEAPNAPTPGGMQTTWTRVKPRRSSSSSESEYSLGVSETANTGAGDEALRGPVLGHGRPARRRRPVPPIRDSSKGQPGPSEQSRVAESAAVRSPGSGKRSAISNESEPQQQQPPPPTQQQLPQPLPADDRSASPGPTDEDAPGLPCATRIIRVPGVSDFGYLEFSLFYNPCTSQLSVNVIRARDLKAMDPNGLSDPYVKLHLLPGGDHRTKMRTKTIQKTLSPEWNELLVYHGLNPTDMLRKTLRLSVLDADIVGYDWIGEYRQPLQEIMPNAHMHLIVPLHSQRKLSQKEQCSGCRGRILVALRYSPADATINVNVIRCTELLAMDPNGYSDPFVKVRLLPDPDKTCKRKTSVKQKTLNPLFDENFVFEVDTSTAISRTLDLQVWDFDRATTNDYIGGAQLSLNARGDLLRHWFDMFKYPNKRLEMWHTLTKIKH